MEGFGIYYYYTGAVYIGELLDGRRHGRGRMRWCNGAVYIGDWDTDKRRGNGYLKQPRRPLVPQIRYVGNWEDNMKHGFGRYDCEDDGSYKGNFEKDEFHGEGQLTLANGNIYEGQFVRGRPQGTDGSYTWRGSGNKYTGNLWRGKLDGIGEMIFQQSGHVFNGQWKLDKASGHGLVQMPNGDEYDGEVKDGFLHGHGSYKWWDKSVVDYTGAFDNGLRHGEGTLHFADGEVYTGHFWEDLRHGHARISADGEDTREEQWHFGCLVERGPEHVLTVEPKVDDIKTWEEFMTQEGVDQLPPEDHGGRRPSHPT